MSVSSVDVFLASLSHATNQHSDSVLLTGLSLVLAVHSVLSRRLLCIRTLSISWNSLSFETVFSSRCRLLVVVGLFDSSSLKRAAVYLREGYTTHVKTIVRSH